MKGKERKRSMGVGDTSETHDGYRTCLSQTWAINSAVRVSDLHSESPQFESAIAHLHKYFKKYNGNALQIIE